MTRKSCRSYKAPGGKYEGKTVFVVKEGENAWPLVYYCQTHGLKYNTVLSRIFRAGIKSDTGIKELRPGRNKLHEEILNPMPRKAGRKPQAG